VDTRTANADPSPDRRASSAESWTQGNWSSLGALPDWQGLWQIDEEKLFGLEMAAQPVPVPTPEYARRQKTARNGRAPKPPLCLPPGMPGIMAEPYPMEFLITPGKVTIAIEAYSQMRRIYTDGRGHPSPPDTLHYGHSIGHWEGDTLVVDTVGIDPKTLLWVSRRAPPLGHSDQIRIIERMHLVTPDLLRVVTTVEDPKALLKPWTYSWDYTRHRDWEIREYICEEENRDGYSQEGKPTVEIGR
jgi:hypothetical protein